MASPSGEKIGSKLGKFAICFNCPPVTDILQTRVSPVRPTAPKTIRFPSGDHEGAPCPPGGSPICVSGFAGAPSKETVQMVDDANAPEPIAARSSPIPLD